ncbi:MAG TPA: M48 family metalloprotease [Phycisphaerales bacterium]|nr:M48 family metalloprotease [Phycisphaerales bacterium]
MGRRKVRSLDKEEGSMGVFMNNIKTTVLMGALMGLFVLVGSYWGTNGMIFAFVLGGLMNIIAWFFSDKMAIAAMHGREVTRETAPELVGMVEELSRRAGLPLPRVYVCPHDAPNAFATGRSPRKAAVAVTRGLLNLMNKDQLEGVISHELAHIKHRDTLISCVAATLAGVLAMIAQSMFWFGAGVRGRDSGNALMGIFVIIIGAVGAALIKAAISRSREFAADAEGAAIAGSPEGLASALLALDGYARHIPLVQPNPAQNNLFIVEPFAGGGLTNLFATHPPVEARIAALRRL